MNFDKIYNGILDNHDISETLLDDILTTLEFRLDKNYYCYQNVKHYIKTNDIENLEYIYFESENLIINIRSTLDILLQLINSIYHMNLKGLDINVKNIVRHPKCPTALKDIFLVYTHPKNQFWNFIYTTRNEIVHEVCIKTHMPVLFDELYIDEEVVYKAMFLNKVGDKEDLKFFYNQCIKLMDKLCEGTLNVLSKGLR